MSSPRHYSTIVAGKRLRGSVARFRPHASWSDEETLVRRDMDTDPSLVGLPADLSAEEAATQFDSLQKKLVPLWRSIESFNQDEQSIIVVPSMSIDMSATGLEVQAYEERFLFLLLLLAQPRARMTYVTSQSIHPCVIEYYLGLLPGIIPSHARRRLTLPAS